jgi:hypothetical protein
MKRILILYFLLFSICMAYSDDFGSSRKKVFKDDNEFLSYIQHQYFKYVWDAALPNSGLSRVRILSRNPDIDRNTITVGSSGFGLAGILVGIERHFITREQGLERLEKALSFLEKSDRFHGIWPHWLNDSTAKVIPFANAASKDNGGDIVETAFLAQGLLCVRQYFKEGNIREKNLSQKANKLWREIEWSWHEREDHQVFWHWSPNYAWEKKFPLKGYNESLAVFILGASSPTHALTKEAYYKSWARDGKIVSDTSLFNIPTHVIHNTGKSFVGPIFWTAFSYIGFDPRGIKDELGINYWDVNVSQTLIQQAYCIANPKHFNGYGENCWGFSAGYSVKGYKAHNTKNDLGVVTPSGTIAAFPYAPTEVMKALKHYYFDLGDELWGPYGFYDGYIVDSNKVIKDYLGNNQCAVLPMIENYRTGLLWKLFMSSPEIKDGLKKLGFTKLKK